MRLLLGRNFKFSDWIYFLAILPAIHKLHDIILTSIGSLSLPSQVSSLPQKERQSSSFSDDQTSESFFSLFPLFFWLFPSHCSLTVAKVYFMNEMPSMRPFSWQRVKATRAPWLEKIPLFEQLPCTFQERRKKSRWIHKEWSYLLQSSNTN